MDNDYQSRLLNLVAVHAHCIGETFKQHQRRVDYMGVTLTPVEMHDCLASVTWHEPITVDDRLTKRDLVKLRTQINQMLGASA